MKGLAGLIGFIDIQSETPGADCNQDGVVDVSDIDCIIKI